jgi:nucleotide-binding universal stress UspA family protein
MDAGGIMSKRDSAHIVVAVDGTPGSHGALRYGIQEAMLRNVGLRLVHVSPSYAALGSWVVPLDAVEVPRIGSEILDLAAAEVLKAAPDVYVERTLVSGSRVTEILRAAADADLLVLGRETQRGAQRVVFGAVTAGVAARSHCAVAVIDPSWRPATSAETRRETLVVGVKSREHADELLAQAFAVATERKLDLVVLHTWELPDPYLDLIERRTEGATWLVRATALLEEVLAPWRSRYPYVNVQARVRHGHPASTLVEAGEGAALVMLLRTPRRLVPWHLGTTAREVLANSATPVHLVCARDEARHEGTRHAETLLHSKEPASPLGDWG